MSKESAILSKAKAKGIVHFLPYENLDQASLQECRKFQVFPLGKIQDNCRHIPYNSGKKDFYEKTGRESFEGEICYFSKLPHFCVLMTFAWN